ncbi:MAG: hypothetical protein ACR2PT_02710, partial [Endozoicomonas sp.]
ELSDILLKNFVEMRQCVLLSKSESVCSLVELAVQRGRYLTAAISVVKRLFFRRKLSNLATR